MSFMQRDIDFKLILLILIVIIAIVGLTLFYQSSAGNIIRKYNKVTENLEQTQANLTTTLAQLELCTDRVGNLSVELDSALEYQLESQDEFNTLYVDTEAAREEAESDLSQTQEELEDTQSELNQKEEDLNVCEETKTANRDAANNADTYAERAYTNLADCKDCIDAATCIACMDNAMSDIGTARNYLDEIQG